MAGGSQCISLVSFRGHCDGLLELFEPPITAGSCWAALPGPELLGLRGSRGREHGHESWKQHLQPPAILSICGSLDRQTN